MFTSFLCLCLSRSVELFMVATSKSLIIARSCIHSFVSSSANGILLGKTSSKELKSIKFGIHFLRALKNFVLVAESVSRVFISASISANNLEKLSRSFSSICGMFGVVAFLKFVKSVFSLAKSTNSKSNKLPPNASYFTRMVLTLFHLSFMDF